MIAIAAKTENGQLRSLAITGHAGYADCGHDIYCAAVSAVFQGALNCLDGPESSYEAQARSGLGSLRVIGAVDQHDKTVLEVMLRELKDLAMSYPEYIRYKEEEK